MKTEASNKQKQFKISVTDVNFPDMILNDSRDFGVFQQAGCGMRARKKTGKE